MATGGGDLYNENIFIKLGYHCFLFCKQMTMRLACLLIHVKVKRVSASAQQKQVHGLKRPVHLKNIT